MQINPSIAPPPLPAQLVAFHPVVEHLDRLPLPALHSVGARVGRLFRSLLCRGLVVLEHPAVADCAVLVLLLELHGGDLPAAAEQVPYAAILPAGVDLGDGDGSSPAAGHGL